MTNIKTRKIWIKAVLLLVTCALLGSFLWHVPTPASADSTFTPNVYMDWKEALTNPRAVNTSNGTYYVPTAYVYFGEFYNSATQKYEPLLNRVLSADGDNVGHPGAIFLMLQNTVSSYRFTQQSDILCDYVSDENDYTESYISQVAYYDLLSLFTHKGYGDYAEELDYIRSVTKYDNAESMDGLLGLYEADGGYYWDVVSPDDPILKDQKIFLLSVEELAQYVGDYSGAVGMAAKGAVNGTYESWWLRTAVCDNVGDKDGNLAAYVTADGNVRYASVQNSMAVRPAFNLETEDIAFAVKVGENTYRLAMHSPDYKDNNQVPFEAEIIDVRDGVVSITTTNYIGNSSFVDDKTEYISYIIFDENGNEKYYGAVGEVDCPDYYSYMAQDYSFKLPDCYEQGDSIKVFWERKNQNGENYISYVSNMVDLGCIHTPAADAPAYCSASATCAICGEVYGKKNADVHIHYDEGYVIDTELDTHSLQCSDCGMLMSTTACRFNGKASPTVCTDYCVCGNINDSPKLHDYDGNGVCNRADGNPHYQMPALNPWSNFCVVVTIENEGQWNAFAQYLNAGGYTFFAGEWLDLTLGADLDFSDMEFIPMGTEEHPIGRIDFNGNYHTISGITFTDTAKSGVGLFGVVEKANIQKLIIKNCKFEGASDVGVVIGHSKNVESNINGVLNHVMVIDCVATAVEGSEGGLIGTCEETNAITGCFLYNVTNLDGEYLDFSGDGNLTVDTVSDYGTGGSYRLVKTEDDDENTMTKAEFASGIVAYRLGLRQKIGDASYPVYDPDKKVPLVYQVKTCDGSAVYYMNENIGQSSHGSYTEYYPDTLEWNENGIFSIGATVNVKCGTCGNVINVVCELDEWFYSNGTLIAKTDFTPYVEINGEMTQVGETVTVISNRIETLIGMTNIEKEYDGQSVSPEELMNNHRLVTSPPADKEYEVYFVNPETGERYVERRYDYYGRPYDAPAAVTNVGVYDLLVVGQSIFEGQEYLYKGALVITRATVTISPQDVYKYYDGNGSFEVSYTMDRDFYDWELDISFTEASSSAVGEYVLNVVMDPNSHKFGNNITVVLDRDTVNAMILPNISLALSHNGNKTYPTEFTYGDPIPTPDASYFEISDAATLSFEWYEAAFDEVYDYDLDDWVFVPISQKKMSGAPVNVGEYLLRVRAVSTDGSMVSATLDLRVIIEPAQLTLELIPPEGAEIEQRDGITYYILDIGECFTYKVHGFVNGDTVESTGTAVSIRLANAQDTYYTISNESVFPYMPYDSNYCVQYTLNINDGNYTRGYDESVYVDMKAPAYTYPVTTTHTVNGESKSVNLVLASPITGLVPNGETFSYTLTVKDGNGRQVASKTANGTALEDIFGYFGGSGEFAIPDTYTVEVSVDGAGMNGSYSYQFTVLYQNDQGEWVDRMTDMGRYKAYVYMGAVTAESVDENGIPPTTAYVYLQREIVMNLKTHYYNLTDGKVIYDPTKVIMEAGKVFALNHTLVDVYFDIDSGNGRINVSGVKVVDQDGNDVSYLYKIVYTIPDYHNADGFNVAHIFDHPCDPTCNVRNCGVTRIVAHSGGMATCSSLAVCDVCGLSYGEYDTERHISTATRILPNVEDVQNSHLVIYTCCGFTKETVEHTPITPATCIALAVCTDCGWAYGEFDPQNHASDDRNYTANGAADHTVTHLCCGGTEQESHIGGTAYCNALAVCTLCRGEHGELDPENHAQQSVFRPDENDRERHNEIYPCCGHSVSYAHEGGDATCIHYAVCEICGGEYGALEPEDHATDALRYELHPDNPSLHNIYHSCCDVYIDKEYHIGGVANCTTPAICEQCRSTYGDIDPNTHATEECNYYRDTENETLHVKVTACCGLLLGTEAHTYGEPTCTHAARCACGAEQGDPLAHVFDNDCDAFCNTCGEQTRAEIFHTGKDGKPCEVCGEMIEKEPISGGAVSGIVTGSTVVVGTGGFSLFWFLIKKKSWAELLGLLIG